LESQGIKSLGAAAKGFSKCKSINQLNELVKAGRLPKSMIRFERGKILGELEHVHFSNNSALYKNGVWKHGYKGLTNYESQILRENGWILSK
jgi:hypothetical protein